MRMIAATRQLGRFGLALILAGCAAAAPPTASPSPTPTPTATPSPTLSATSLARGNFSFHVFEVELDATGEGADVTGTMSVSSPDGDFVVDLECALTTEDGLTFIGGDVTDSTHTEYAPVGSRTAIVIERGSPVRVIFLFQMTDPRAASCPAFLEGSPESAIRAGDEELQPIRGTLELAP